MPDISQKVVEELRTLMKRQVGTFAFDYTFDALFDPHLGNGTIMELTTGQIIFRLERDANLNVHFYHASPGTGTRVATVNLNEVEKSPTVKVVFTWSPDRIALAVGSNGKPIIQEGRISKKQFRVDLTGAVVQVGDEGVQVMAVTAIENGKEVLSSTAIETWNETLESIRILLRGTSTDGYLFESICTNLCIVMMVTGFESYCKRRFLEIEDEGIQPNFEALVKKFTRQTDRENFGLMIKERAKLNNISPLRQFINEDKINFQNYEKCKDAYKSAFGIKFPEDIRVDGVLITNLKELIEYRHRVIHVSPLSAMPKPDPTRGVGVKPPKNEYAHKGMKIMDTFVQGLHRATLNLHN